MENTPWLGGLPSQIKAGLVGMFLLGPVNVDTALAGITLAERLVLAADVTEEAANKVDGEPSVNKSNRELSLALHGDQDQGQANYLNACASCHYGGKGKLQLGDRSALGEDDPEEFIEVTLFGIAPEFGESGLEMPGYARSFSDAEVAQLAAAMRATLTTKPPWPGLEAAITKQRAKGAED